MATNPKPKSHDALARYRDKRSADRTTEPFGAESEHADETRRRARPLVFVVQQHDARRMHWDVRLEFDGVLRSWAVPQGPSLDPSVKRLAVLTEDHPIEYRDFEGVIPEGNYGAGAMILWDRGTYVPMEKEGEGFEQGKLLFELRGHKLRGVWTLVRTKRGGGKEWLLIKKPDAAAREGESALDPHSVLSGLTVQELASGSDRSRRVREQLETAGAVTASTPIPLSPMLCEVHEEAFDDRDWIFELKYDGYRLLAHKGPTGVELRYRSGRDAADAFPEVARTLAALPFDRFVLDGEVVVLDDDGRPNFHRLQRRAKLERPRDLARASLEHPVVYYAFDLLAFDGLDARPLPLEARKRALHELLPGSGPIRFADHVEEHGRALFEQVRKLGVEGVVGKRRDSGYVAGRSPNWRKIRFDRTDDFVIVGYRRAKGSRVGLGSVHVASHLGPTLTHVGRVGSGISEQMLGELRSRLDAIARPTPACELAPGATKADEDVWVEPQLVCEVRFREITEGGQLRFPVFLRLRDDKSAAECELREEPGGSERSYDGEDGDDQEHAAGETGESARAVVISNPDKVFWPASGRTKGDLVEYYRRIARWLLPYLHDRPLVLTRYPDGIEGKSFFQKNAPPYVPQWLATKTVWSEHAKREVTYFVCNDVESLSYVANLGAIPLHVWASRVDDLQRPDWCVLDLDPKGAPFEHVVRIALEIRSICQEIGMPCFPKTSGSTGLHVLLPLGRQCTHAQSRQLAGILGQIVTSRLPELATLARSLERREGKVYVDTGQNGHGRLIVAPFSVRPLPGAPVSTPLDWSEVVPSLEPGRWTMDEVPDRMEARRTDPLVEVLSPHVGLPEVLAKLATTLED